MSLLAVPLSAGSSLWLLVAVEGRGVCFSFLSTVESVCIVLIMFHTTLFLKDSDEIFSPWLSARI